MGFGPFLEGKTLGFPGISFSLAIDGKEVSRETIEPMLLASEKSKGTKPVVMNIGLDTITKFS